MPVKIDGETLPDDRVARFWAKVGWDVPTDYCWLWTGRRNRDGYGMSRVAKGRGAASRFAHRIAWVLVNGELPQSTHVRHKCGERSCCNPGHLTIQKLDERFWQYVSKGGEDECWLWTGFVNVGGYGRFRPSSKEQTGAHRFSYEMHKGPIPDEYVVCHTCDVRHCVNPAHLILGTSADNTRDMMERNRQRGANRDSNPRAVLSSDQAVIVACLLLAGRQKSEIARRFEVRYFSINSMYRDWSGLSKKGVRKCSLVSPARQQ